MVYLTSYSGICLAALLITAQAQEHLNITALTGRDNISVLECWQFVNPFIMLTTPGRIGTQSLQLPSPANASYDIIPSHFDGVLHNAPRRQFVWWISGQVHFTLPNATDEAWIYGGKNGLIFAEDTADVSEWGHGTAFPSDEETVALTMPTVDGVVPEHTVLHNGACGPQELSD
ncbi:uncharacterized protein BCR38DRAFT_338379 [Pseudomassariella vexata]|uniref:Small secreted protein n=1 Tax=Pseudomassariella vexata TaxID=1141098 RepID=A0A1Y2E8A8_9PEZI|nr:uncharacterized protein BCR38DRAFT_338379 [Pseudomassariella vexata]ORY67801.1 hypothetical protein BCR38DRAFT_338379 [Pseudomassariella vexata]